MLFLDTYVVFYICLKYATEKFSSNASHHKLSIRFPSNDINLLELTLSPHAFSSLHFGTKNEYDYPNWDPGVHND